MKYMYLNDTFLIIVRISKIYYKKINTKFMKKLVSTKINWQFLKAIYNSAFRSYI